MESLSYFYTKKFVYAPTKPKVVLVGLNNRNQGSKPHFCPKLNNKKEEVPSCCFHLVDIVKHPAAVFFPYSVNSFKQTELYSV